VVVPESRLAFARSPASRRLGIMPTYPTTLADLPEFGDQRLQPEAAVDGARQLVLRLVTLPTHSGLSGADLDALEQWVREVR
jgi:hypothetical protein